MVNRFLLKRSGFIAFIFTVVLINSFPSLLFSQAGGMCSNCHTMHNRQDGDDPSGPHESLTTDSCVGCHSSSSSQTIVSLGSGDVPIVFNTSLPAAPLAGGNFYWISSQSDSTLGHNVRSIAGPDTNITYVPGRQIGGDDTLTITDCYNCHSLGFPPGYPGIPVTIARSGNILICEDCHTQVRHHADDSATVVDDTGGWYRFLYNVKGIEDPDWQQTVSESDHNEYQGETAAFGNSISDAGCGCHGDFHSLKNSGGVGTASLWKRHPADIALPAGGEYASYTIYNPDAPVARPDLSGYSGPDSTVNPGTDQVMCISCHRAHGSDQPDMLRWDYSGIIANGGSSTEGCFICHSAKDDGL